jgi:hypothetical protein
VEYGGTGSSTGALDHGGLSGKADDDHTQYALLAGRSGGQTLAGDSTAVALSGALTLKDNANGDGAGITLESRSGALVNAGLSPATSTAASALSIRHTSTGAMADGFGVQLGFQFRDTDAVTNVVARVTAVRTGADNTADMVLYTANAGSLGERLRMAATGAVTAQNAVVAMAHLHAQAPGSYTVPTGYNELRTGRLTLTSSQRTTMAGTARMRMID